jgi:acetylglutamate kinase
MEQLIVVKIGGNIIDDDKKLASFITSFSAIPTKKILIHGGGKLATKLAIELGIEQQMIDGRRITDAETLKVVTMVYAGYINKNIVAQLQAHNCNAIGLSGADANLIAAVKRPMKNGVDYGFVGDVVAAPSVANWQLLLDNNFVPIIAPITHNNEGQLLNTNADTIAQEVAKALSSIYDVQLIYSFEKSGVLMDADDDDSIIKSITPHYYQALKEQKIIFAGMIPKLDNAFEALNCGVKKVVIGHAEKLTQLITGTAGTAITHDDDSNK